MRETVTARFVRTTHTHTHTNTHTHKQLHAHVQRSGRLLTEIEVHEHVSASIDAIVEEEGATVRTEAKVVGVVADALQAPGGDLSTIVQAAIDANSPTGMCARASGWLQALVLGWWWLARVKEREVYSLFFLFCSCCSAEESLTDYLEGQFSDLNQDVCVWGGGWLKWAEEREGHTHTHMHTHGHTYIHMPPPVSASLRWRIWTAL